MSKNIVIVMLTDRGYTDIQEQLQSDQYTKLTITFKMESKGEKSGVVWWVEDSKIGINHVLHFTQKCAINDYKKFILIIDGTVTPSAKKELTTTIKELYDAEYFYTNELKINTTKHIYVPRHILLSEEEKEFVRKSYRTDLINFPQILESDPVAKYFNFKSGDLIKIERMYNLYTQHLDEIPFEISYRYVINE